MITSIETDDKGTKYLRVSTVSDAARIAGAMGLDVLFYHIDHSDKWDKKEVRRLFKHHAPGIQLRGCSRDVEYWEQMNVPVPDREPGVPDIYGVWFVQDSTGVRLYLDRPQKLTE